MSKKRLPPTENATERQLPPDSQLEHLLAEGERWAKCPKCKAPQTGIILRAGKLWCADSELLGYVCCRCGQTIHWGRRGR
jgi:hypothetical protein